MTENRTTENELLQMSEHFKQVVTRKDREIKLVKSRCSDGDEYLRSVKDKLIEMNVIVRHLAFLSQINLPSFIQKHMCEELTTLAKKMMHDVDECRETIDYSDLTEDFFEAFEDQI